MNVGRHVLRQIQSVGSGAIPPPVVVPRAIPFEPIASWRAIDASRRVEAIGAPTTGWTRNNFVGGEISPSGPVHLVNVRVGDDVSGGSSPREYLVLIERANGVGSCSPVDAVPCQGRGTLAG